MCLDADDAVWLTPHPGSRNIGKELAERDIATVKGLAHNQDLPDRDLACFLARSDEMNAYLYDLRWAQDYAAHSRTVMIGLFRVAVAGHFRQTGFDVLRVARSGPANEPDRSQEGVTVDDLRARTDGVECRKDAGAVDEIPGACKDLNQVIEAQSGLVEVVNRLWAVVCVKV